MDIGRVCLFSRASLLCVFLLVLSLTANARRERTHTHIGVILPWKFNVEWSLDRGSRAAIEYAVNSVRSSSKRAILPNRNITITYGDSECSETKGPLVAFDMFVNETADVFIGPACDYVVAHVARYSPYWNIPILTAGAWGDAFRNKTVFKLLTRVGGTDNTAAKFMLDLMRFYNWSVIGMMYTLRKGSNKGRTKCFFTMEAIYYAYKAADRRHTYYNVFAKHFDESDPNLSFEEILMATSQKARIVVLCASPDTVREIMITAHELGFTNGEYVFFNIDLFSSKKDIIRPWERVNDTKQRNDYARKAYEALMTVTLRKPESEEYKNFSEEVKRRAREGNDTAVYGSTDDDKEVNSFVGAFHDAVILYAIALNETLAANGDPTNGTAITQRMWNRTFTGITGNVSIDEFGDRNADYSLLDMDPETGNFTVVANYYGSHKEYVPVPNKKIHWAGGRLDPPPDKPKCGFDGKLCPDEALQPWVIAISVVVGVLVLVIVVAFTVYKLMRPSPYDPIYWKIEWDDITFGTFTKPRLDRSTSRYSLNRRYSMDAVTVTTEDSYCPQIFIKTGYYKGNQVAIKKINKSLNGNPSKSLLMELKAMRDLQNDHIVRFHGLCIDHPNQCIVTEYCVKGSLQDVLENEQVKLDNMFKFSLMQDIVRGMSYLHNSEIKSHGNLKSSNCVIDSRFVLKITDFGLHSLRSKHIDEEADKHAYYRDKLWTAPELLRQLSPLPQGTQKGDVYSFAIICQEIVCRQGPFWLKLTHLSPKDIVEKVKEGAKEPSKRLRPCLPTDGESFSEEMNTMISRCWDEDANVRQDFHTLKTTVRKINKDADTGNILDNLLQRMEQYANNLESLVEERTADYLEQKKKAEDLLYMMLPKQVAGTLMRGQPVEAERYDGVTIYFSDIVGFTSLSAESTPMEVIDLLNDLYTTFDSIIGKFDVYKVETIGDAYMVVSGLPIRNGNLHAREIARMSLALLNGVRTFKVRHKPDYQLRIRIGLHSGPVCAGVVGLKMPRYCLFGDTVNTASRMESNGEPLKVHVNPATKRLLDDFGTFVLIERGSIEVKGKGTMDTFWLLGENNPEFPDFAPRESVT